jgi:hypothetical protein
MGSAVSVATDSARAGELDHTAGCGRGDAVVVLDLFPLTSPLATQVVLCSDNTRLTFGYRTTDMSITEPRRQELEADLASSLRVDLESVLNATDAGGSERPIEDDRYRLVGCRCSGQCTSIAGAISTAPPQVRRIIERLVQSGARDKPVPTFGSYLRCLPVTEQRWSRLESRGTYKLYDKSDLGETAARAVSLALDSLYTFVPLSDEEDEVLGERIALDQIFVSVGGAGHSCERFTVVVD